MATPWNLMRELLTMNCPSPRATTAPTMMLLEPAYLKACFLSLTGVQMKSMFQWPIPRGAAASVVGSSQTHAPKCRKDEDEISLEHLRFYQIKLFVGNGGGGGVVMMMIDPAEAAGGSYYFG